MQRLAIAIAGEAPVAATWFAAADTQPPGDVFVVAPALATPQRFYFPFCEWLASQGHAALTFDYRGLETGSATQARASRTDMETWLRVDVSAAVDEAVRRADGRTMRFVGHSLGGMALGSIAGLARIESALTVACGSGYPGLNPRSGGKLWLLGRVLLPLYTRLFGYFPGGRLRKVGNLPPGVALQWARWLRERHFFFADPAYDMSERFAAVRCRVLSLSFVDDAAIQRPAVDDLHRRYSGAAVQRVHLAPGDAGLDRIGHMGFFRPDAKTLWHSTLRWLQGSAWRLPGDRPAFAR